MISCTTEVFVKGKTASQVFDWFINLDQEKYLQWHPDHTRYEVLKPTDEYLGSIVYYEQKLEGAGANFKWEVTEVIENEILLYKARFIYPISLLITMTNRNGSVQVTHDLRLGYSSGILTKILDLFVEKFIFTKRSQIFSDKHTKEELKNLEWLL